MKTRAVVCVFCVICPALARSQSQLTNQAPASIVVKAGKLLDVRRGSYIDNAAVWIEDQRIKEVGRAIEVQMHAPKSAKVVDLGHVTLLPGLIDCHTHIMARIADADNGYALNLATKSQAFRALEGAFDARLTLNAGFTTIRDVENEGSGYADVALRDAITQGLAEGPHMQVATRGIAVVGQYNPFGISPDLSDFPTGAQMVSGVEEARRAAREQIGHGADLIKVYADWDYPTFTVEEMHAIVEEAHKERRKVAAHATTAEGMKNAITAGVDSIEHGFGADRESLEMMKARGTFLVPTVGVVDAQLELRKNEPLTAEQRQRRDAFLQGIQQSLQLAVTLGLKIASGSDASSPASQGRNADQLIAMVRRGMTPLEVIRAATINAAELMGWQEDVGAIEAGKYADLIAVEGDPLANIALLQQVQFVMKSGAVTKNVLIH
jgi:imidazolonepropionase-like amidohydrolase